MQVFPTIFVKNVNKSAEMLIKFLLKSGFLLKSLLYKGFRANLSAI